MNKKIILIVVAVIAIAGALVFLNRTKPEVKTPAINTGTQNQEGQGAETPAQVESKPAPKPVSKPTANPAYGEAVKQYEGRRIQFNENCQATPSQATYKNGTSVMLDNRANKARTIIFNLKKYQIEAYGFKIVTASNPTLPATTFIDCDSSQNVATILIQK